MKRFTFFFILACGLLHADSALVQQAQTSHSGRPITWGSTEIIPSMTPFTMSNLEALRFQSLIYEGLLQMDADDNITPLLADFACDSDNTGISFTIKDGIKWSNGADFTTEDIVFSYRLLSNKKTFSPYSAIFSFIETVRQPAPRQVHFSFKYSVFHPERYFVNFPVLPAEVFKLLKKHGKHFEVKFKGFNLCESPGGRKIISIPFKAIVEKLNEKKDGWIKVRTVSCAPIGKIGWIPEYAQDYLIPDSRLIQFPKKENSIGTGPFSYNRSDTEGTIHLSKNRHYHEKGRPYLDGISREIITSRSDLIEKLNHGTIDISYFIPNATALKFSDKTVRVIPLNSLTFTSIVLNLSDPFLKIKANRKAMIYGFNRKNALTNIYGIEQADALLAGPCSPDSWSYSSEIQPVPFDIGKARALLKGSHPDKPLRLLIDISDKSNKNSEICNLFMSDMHQLGITVKLVRVEKGEYLARLKKGDFDLAYITWMLGPSYELSPIFGSGKPMNYGHYSNKAVDSLLLRIAKSSDSREMGQLAESLQRALIDDVPHIFLWSLKENLVFNKNLHGIDEEINPYLIFDNAKTWYFN